MITGRWAVSGSHRTASPGRYCWHQLDDNTMIRIRVRLTINKYYKVKMLIKTTGGEKFLCNTTTKLFPIPSI